MLRFLQSLFQQSLPPMKLSDDIQQIQSDRDDFLIASETFEISSILKQFPPQLENDKKKIIFEAALDDHPDAMVTVERYEEISLPSIFQPFLPATEVESVQGYFQYSDQDDRDHWYMNFAHHNLFNGYGHFMFAQDEIQVAEHPALASLRELMLQRSDRLRPRTVESGMPTPVLFRSVPRTLNIDTRQIYGTRFNRAEYDLIRKSAQPVAPPTHSNILAIEAPIPTGNQIYTRGEIEHAFITAYSGFRSAVLTSASHPDSFRPIVLHTGNWGCGAYGGNRQLMISLQIMAACLAGISKIVFHCGAESTASVGEFESALTKKFQFKPGAKTSTVVNLLVQSAFKWGTPDGN